MSNVITHSIWHCNLVLDARLESCYWELQDQTFQSYLKESRIQLLFNCLLCIYSLANETNEAWSDLQITNAPSIPLNMIFQAYVACLGSRRGEPKDQAYWCIIGTAQTNRQEHCGEFEIHTKAAIWKISE